MSHLDRVIDSFTLLLGLFMLIGPLWILWHISPDQTDMTGRLSVITAFLVVFALFLGFLTKARPFEVLAATAAYGAILVVFLQLGSGGAGGN